MFREQTNWVVGRKVNGSHHALLVRHREDQRYQFLSCAMMLKVWNVNIEDPNTRIAFLRELAAHALANQIMHLDTQP